MNLIDLISKHPIPVTRFQRPYVIAEAGVNHEGSMDIARRLIDEAALGGADAIKFQTYKAGTLASKHSPGLLGHQQRADSEPVRAVQKARLLLERRISKT